MAQHDGADVGAPVARQAFLGDGHVVLDLTADQLADVFHIHAVGKFHDLGDAQAGLVRQALFRGVADRQFQQHPAILFQQDDVGVVVDDADPDLVALAFQGQVDVKDQVGFGGMNVQLHLAHVVPDGSLLLLGDGTDDLQLPVRVAGHDACAGGSSHAVEAAGVGDDDALDILDDVAADMQVHLLR